MKFVSVPIDGSDDRGGKESIEWKGAWWRMEDDFRGIVIKTSLSQQQKQTWIQPLLRGTTGCIQ